MFYADTTIVIDGCAEKMGKLVISDNSRTQAPRPISSSVERYAVRIDFRAQRICNRVSVNDDVAKWFDAIEKAGTYPSQVVVGLFRQRDARTNAGVHKAEAAGNHMRDRAI